MTDSNPFHQLESITSRDPGARGITDLIIPGTLERTARILKNAGHVVVVSGCFIPEVEAGETDGPPGTLFLKKALEELGIQVTVLTDEENALLFRAIGITPIVVTSLRDHPATRIQESRSLLESLHPTHLVAIERVGRTADGTYRNMRGEDISKTTEPLDELFLLAPELKIETIGIGDGGNEIGMGSLTDRIHTGIPLGDQIACIIPCSEILVSGTSNTGALGLIAGLSILSEKDLLPNSTDLEWVLCSLLDAGARDGRTRLRTPTVDGLDLAAQITSLDELRAQIAP